MRGADEIAENKYKLKVMENGGRSMSENYK